MSRAHFFARIDKANGELVAVDVFQAGSAENAPRFATPAKGEWQSGDWVEVRVEGAEARSVEPRLAEAGSAAAAMLGVALKLKLDPVFPPEVEREVAAILADPGIDDPALRDLTDLSFVTIDNEDSRDLDQAMFLERTQGGYRVLYALADGAHFVRPGTALFDEAIRRGATYYLPGFAVPMLPRALCEDLMSLNPRVDRRALVVEMVLDAVGEVKRTDFYRARIRSRAKLSYAGVQDYFDSSQRGDEGADHALAGESYSETLDLLEEVGAHRAKLAAERDVVRFRRHELSVQAGPAGTRFTLLARDRHDCERWNEQISLLCNTEGARFFSEAGRLPNLQPVFRVHAPPHHRRVAELARTIEALCARAKLDPEIWLWHRERGESLADYLDRLHSEDTVGSEEAGARVNRARSIQRLALVINNRSEFDDEPAPHHGVGAESYARFSSPMREMVGIFTHKEAVELIEGRAADAAGPGEAELQARVIETGNQSKRLQSQATKAANRVAIDAVLAPDLEQPFETRPRRSGVLMSLAPNKATIALVSPPVELKVYFDALEHELGAAAPTCEADASLLAFSVDDETFLLGDEIELVVAGLKDGRWALAPASPLAQGSL